MINYYIYIYLDPCKSGRYFYDDICFLFEPFYVGKGKNGRIKNIRDGRSNDFIDIINKIKENGLEPIKFKLYENLSEEKSLELETKTINEIGRIDLGTGFLINRTSGGQGSSGYEHTEEELKKRRKNFQDIKKEFEIRKYILLTEENDYKNAHQKLKYICPEGHEGSMNWDNFRQEKNCPICCIKYNSEKQRKDFQTVKKEFERRIYILLTEEKDYKNNYTKLNYICPEGHKGSIAWGNFQREQGCYICFNKLRSEKMKGKNSILIIQDVIQIKLLLKEGKLKNKEIAEIFEVK